MDMAVNQGYRIHTDAFDQMTGFVTVPITASKNKGIAELVEAVIKDGAAEPSPIRETPLPGANLPQYDNVLKTVRDNLPAGHLGPWLTSKLLEGDAEVAVLMAEQLSPEEWDGLKAILPCPEEGQLTMAKARYDWIGNMLPGLVAGSPRHYKRNGFDVAATHPIWGKLIALGVMFFGVIAAYLVALPLMIPGFAVFFSAEPLQRALTGVVPALICNLIGDGLMGGLSISLFILGFIGAFSIVLGFLENSGYLARLAYCFDPFMRRIGLHGKAIMPLIMGFVCNILGVAGSRIIDTWKQRLTTLFIAPIIPCKGLFIVVSFIIAVFFGTQAPFVFFSLALVTIAYLSATSLILRKHILKGGSSGLIMELPPYHMPTWRNIRIFATLRMKIFYDRGFWLILATCVIVWFGINFPGGSIDNSYLAVLGKKLEFFGRIVGWDWRFCITFLIAIISKEATLGAMVVIFSATTVTDTDLVGMAMDQDLWAYIRGGDFGSFIGATGLSRASALSFVFAVYFSLPCVATLGAIFAETRSILITLAAFFYYFSMSIIMGGLAYLAGLMVF
jgi:ferrous iron transport protein B